MALKNGVTLEYPFQPHQKILLKFYNFVLELNPDSSPLIYVSFTS